MQHHVNEILRTIFSLNRFFKKSIAILSDIFLCIFTVWFAFYLRLEEFAQLKDIVTPILISILLSITIFWLFGVYRTLFRYAGLSILSTITLSSFIYGIIYFLIISIYVVKDDAILAAYGGVPRSIGLIQPILLFLGIIASRFTVKYLLTGTFRSLMTSRDKENILIYGAGTVGSQLLTSLENNMQYKVVGFLDDNPQLHRQSLLGQKIYDPKKLDYLIQSKNINLVLFAIPSISKIKKNQIIEMLNNYKLIVKSLPNANDIINEKVSVSDIKDYLIDDLLNRDSIIPNKKLMEKNIKSKTVMVTGAGGTIGSEICRQILKLSPKRLILFELNEFALYEVNEELITTNKDIKIIPLLGNVQDQSKLEKIFKTFRVDTVYHSAAYKHVPLVEENICEGIKNNIMGTLAVTKATINQKVENLVLISSDKAVRPTNIMGATKRFSELCLQGYKKYDENISTNFSIVRFGNVLDSSGSVIPKFKDQIKKGGPITLTHNDVTRYFMTISEAAQLVIQAGALGKNSEVFILDMGESIKIKDLIKRMVNLSGLTLCNNENQEGDIEIKIIGLRPGEKLYEELLIGDNPQKTIHSKIRKTEEPDIPFDQLKKYIDELIVLLENQQPEKIKKLLDDVIKLYNSNFTIVDHIYNEDQELRNDYKKSSISEKNNNIVKIK